MNRSPAPFKELPPAAKVGAVVLFGFLLTVGLAASSSAAAAPLPKPKPKPTPPPAPSPMPAGFESGVRQGIQWEIRPLEGGEYQGWIGLPEGWAILEGAKGTSKGPIRAKLFAAIDALTQPEEPEETPTLPKWEGGPVPPIPKPDEQVPGES